MAAYTTIDNPELYFQCKLYTGNGSTNAITLDGDEDMQPNMIWFKCRSAAEHHGVFDNVRGVTKVIYPNLTNTEDTVSDSLSSFNTDGFTLGADTGSGGAFNGDTKTMVAWCWKESATAGFDIISYTGNGTSGRTVSHNLSAVPEFIIIKPRDQGDNWRVYHKGIDSSAPEDYHLQLQDTSAKSDNATMFNDTAPTSSVFSLGNNSGINGNTNTFISYVFSGKQGYSKFGSYQGNSNANGSFIYCGFSPAWIMVKKINETDSADWLILDNKRDTFNVRDSHLDANQADAEGSATWVYCDFLSNGFKWRANDETHNESGSTYVFIAFAEAPFVNSNGVPANAR